MKHLTVIIIIFLVVTGCNTTKTEKPTPLIENNIPDTSDLTNNFYDNTEIYKLNIGEIYVDGEISNPGKVDMSRLPVRSVFVKETLLDSAGIERFVGAYRYDGYSLFDILDRVVPDKKNAKEFNPVIDIFVEVSNARGEKVVFSWGEIYYPNTLHRILIAGSVSRIVPSRSKDLWPLPSESKIVAANDLITERNISSPVRITVRSYPRSFIVARGMSPLYTDTFSLFDGEKQVSVLSPVSEPESVTYNTIFYGRGRGIHTTLPFSGMLLKDMIKPFYPLSQHNLKAGLFCITGKDGYRCAVSYSELFNRNDQQEFLLVRTEKDEDGGLFRVFPAADFFSDRAVKSLSGIYFELF
jgi:hypothetical protein